jgi:2-keto-4-pentenoate hydratase/2-oxohepta-3-ene-1,7-dioic acid hydratase in catechol pathway
MIKKISFVIFIQLICIMLNAQNPSGIKLFRFGTFENEKPAVEMPDGRKLDVSAFGEDYNEKFFSTDGITRLGSWLAKNESKCPRVPSDTRIGSCIVRPSKIVAIGLNYVEHAKEGAAGVSMAVPKEPIIFMKSTTALCGPFDNVIIPKNSKKLDWEVELAVIISRKASYVSEADAMNYVAGYTVVNDYSEREWQLEKDGNQWDKGKSSDTFAPLGPYLIPAFLINDPQNLNLWLKVNGKSHQSANTRDMIFNLRKLISYVSEHMTLLPGDVICTGTPSGVGNGQNPPVFLREGDIVELGVDKIGSQKQVIVSFEKSISKK